MRDAILAIEKNEKALNIVLQGQQTGKPFFFFRYSLDYRIYYVLIFRSMHKRLLLFLFSDRKDPFENIFTVFDSSVLFYKQTIFYFLTIV